MNKENPQTTSMREYYYSNDKKQRVDQTKIWFIIFSGITIIFLIIWLISVNQNYSALLKAKSSLENQIEIKNTEIINSNKEIVNLNKEIETLKKSLQKTKKK